MISNVDWILTKNRLMEQTRLLLADLQDQQLRCISAASDWLPPEVAAIPPKISRGENYEGLPWLMLDLPRLFSASDQFAIRSFFWWGNGFSLSLQLKGQYQLQFGPAFGPHQSLLAQEGWQLGIHRDPWQHHFRQDNYQPVSLLAPTDWDTHLRQHPFLKLSYILPVTQWEEIPVVFGKQYQLLLKIMGERPG